MRIENLTAGRTLAIGGQWARTWPARAKGLLGRERLDDGEALVIYPCQSVHSFFMRFPIDVLFLNRDLQVVGVRSEMRPFRLSRHMWKACYVVEVPSGAAARTGTKIGDILAFEE